MHLGQMLVQFVITLCSMPPPRQKAAYIRISVEDYLFFNLIIHNTAINYLSLYNINI